MSDKQRAKKIRNILESDEQEIIAIHKARTGETQDYQIRQAIKKYCQDLRKHYKL